MSVPVYNSVHLSAAVARQGSSGEFEVGGPDLGKAAREGSCASSRQKVCRSCADRGGHAVCGGESERWCSAGGTVHKHDMRIREQLCLSVHTHASCASTHTTHASRCAAL